MNIARFAEPVTIAFRKSAGGLTVTFEPHRDYLIANAQFDRIMQDENVKKRLYKVSKMDTRVRNFHVASLNRERRERILFFNGSGGYGDAVMSWPIVKYLSRFADVFVLTDPGNNVCYWGFPWVKGILTIPVAWEVVRMFEHFVHFEAVVNMDEHPDQGHPVDMMFHKIGVDPQSVDAQEKVVRPYFTYGEQASAQQWRGKRLGLYQLSSANPVRGLPVSDSVFLARKLAEAMPDMHWLALFDEFVPKEYKETLEKEVAEKNLTNLQPCCFQNLRELWAATEIASCVVAPDSMMVHIAGAFGVPCVGLWGPMEPTRRTQYYTNHHAIFHPEFCPHSPCFCYSSVFPKYCPPRPTARTVCEVLAGIPANEVAELVKQVRR